MVDSQDQPRPRGASAAQENSPQTPTWTGTQRKYPAEKNILDREIPLAKPSASIILISPKNEVLMMHRVAHAKSFAGAYTFPGGKISRFHERTFQRGVAVENEGDCLEFRLAALRETFEETGILLARDRTTGKPLNIPDSQREAGRRLVFSIDNHVRFREWVQGLGGEPDTMGLVPFTRWISPSGARNRYNTQMYLYMLPLEEGKQCPTGSSAAAAMVGGEVAGGNKYVVADPGGLLEHTEAEFAPASTWEQRAARGEVAMYPPQVYLVSFLSRFLTAGTQAAEDLAAQRQALLDHLREGPTGGVGVLWSDLVISPERIGTSGNPDDYRVKLGLSLPKGDPERVMYISMKDDTAMYGEVARIAGLPNRPLS